MRHVNVNVLGRSKSVQGKRCANEKRVQQKGAGGGESVVILSNCAD